MDEMDWALVKVKGDMMSKRTSGKNGTKKSNYTWKVEVYISLADEP